MLIEVRPGEGGKDAEAFAEEMYRALFVIADGRSDDVRRPEPRILGPRIWSFAVADPGILDTFVGTHRVQRIPKGATARHTSTCTVALVDEKAVVGTS